MAKKLPKKNQFTAHSINDTKWISWTLCFSLVRFTSQRYVQVFVGFDLVAANYMRINLIAILKLMSRDAIGWPRFGLHSKVATEQWTNLCLTNLPNYFFTERERESERKKTPTTEDREREAATKRHHLRRKQYRRRTIPAFTLSRPLLCVLYCFTLILCHAMCAAAHPIFQ